VTRVIITPSAPERDGLAQLRFFDLAALADG
jgi:hypothetical protein